MRRDRVGAAADHLGNAVREQVVARADEPRDEHRQRERVELAHRQGDADAGLTRRVEGAQLARGVAQRERREGRRAEGAAKRGGTQQRALARRVELEALREAEGGDGNEIICLWAPR